MTPWPMNPMGHDLIVSGGTVTPDPDPLTFLTRARTVSSATVVGGTITGGTVMASGSFSFVYDPDNPPTSSALYSAYMDGPDKAGEAWAEVTSGAVTTPVAGMGGLAFDGASALGQAKLFIRDYVSAQDVVADQADALIAVMGPYAKVTRFVVSWGGTITIADDCEVSDGTIQWLPCYFYGTAGNVTIVMDGGTCHKDTLTWNGIITEDTFPPDN